MKNVTHSINNLGTYYNVSIECEQDTILVFVDRFNSEEDANLFLKSKLYKGILRTCLKEVGGQSCNTDSIKKILNLHSKGFLKAAIVKMGFNKSTVYRQVTEHIKKTTYAISYVPPVDD